MTKLLKKPCRSFVRISCSARDALRGSAGKAAGMSRKVCARSARPIWALKWPPPSRAVPWRRYGRTRKWRKVTAPCLRRRAGGRAYALPARNAALHSSPTRNSARNAAQKSTKKSIAPSAESRWNPARNSVPSAAQNRRTPDSALFFVSLLPILPPLSIERGLQIRCPMRTLQVPVRPTPSRCFATDSERRYPFRFP